MSLTVAVLATDPVASMRHLAETSVNDAMRVVLVTDHIREEHLPRAVLHGLVGVVPRHGADQDRVTTCPRLSVSTRSPQRADVA
jgi:hypothetical protein